jgi:hypothetical protein
MRPIRASRFSRKRRPDPPLIKAEVVEVENKILPPEVEDKQGPPAEEATFPCVEKLEEEEEPSMPEIVIQHIGGPWYSVGTQRVKGRAAAEALRDEMWGSVP